MPSLQVFLDSSRMAIRPHVCPKCLGPMILILIKPLLVGREIHIFEGVNFDHFDKVVTETNTMRWLSSLLKAPV
jgi:hypothetical protein